MFGKNLFKVSLAAAVLLATSELLATAADTTKTVYEDPSKKAKLLGQHKLSLQWLQFEKPQYGNAVVTEKNGVLYLKGEQRGTGKEKGYLTVDGRITEVGAKSFKFNGKIKTCISHINNGKECLREGDMTFLAKGKRKYWRLQEMDNPCSEVTDYVDVYFN